MTPAQRARLGGLTAAQNMTPQARSDRARKAQAAFQAKYGSAGHYRLALAGASARTERAQKKAAAQTTANTNA